MPAPTDVLVIGAGGLGSPAIQYLAAAGVGTIGVVDDDAVSLSNLQRQVIHTDSRIGMPKVFSAQQAIAAEQNARRSQQRDQAPDLQMRLSLARPRPVSPARPGEAARPPAHANGWAGRSTGRTKKRLAISA